MYDKIDALIVTAIGGGRKTFSAISSTGPVEREALLLSMDSVRARGEGWRVVDRRLQALRRKGRITYSRAEGWRVSEAQ